MAHEDEFPEGDEGAVAEEEVEGGRAEGTRGRFDTVRKALGQGFRTVLSREEKLRGLVTDAMPKELVSYLKGTIDAGKDELVRIVGAQTRKFLEGIDVSGEVAKLLTSLSFEIKTEIRFIPNDQKVKPDVRVSARAKRAQDAKRAGGGDESEG